MISTFKNIIKLIFIIFYLNLILKQTKNYFFDVGHTILYHEISFHIILYEINYLMNM